MVRRVNIIALILAVIVLAAMPPCTRTLVRQVGATPAAFEMDFSLARNLAVLASGAMLKVVFPQAEPQSRSNPQCLSAALKRISPLQQRIKKQAYCPPLFLNPMLSYLSTKRHNFFSEGNDSEVPYLSLV